MITAYELRKGNLLLFHGNIVHVGGMSYSDFDNDHDMEWLGIRKLDETNEIHFHGQEIYTNGAFVEGIPLTPEILTEWCGFKKSYGTHLSLNIFGLSSAVNFRAYMGKPPVNLYIDINDNDLDGSGDINYLHQLQNLYYALTGTELEIKIPAKV